MAGVIKGVIRIGVVGGLLAGGALLVAGPQRITAIGRQIHSRLITAIDRNIDDPIAMRSQLRDLESKYPRRIAEARAMLAELNEQARQVDRDRAISERVVALAQSDLDDMKDLLARAEDARSSYTGVGRQIVSVAFHDRKMNLDEAYTQANRIADTVTSYQSRTVESERELEQLGHDARQTESLLGKLLSEYADFQTQLADLDRKIDSVSRKERMVKLVKDRQRRIDELSRYKVESLDQFKANLASRVAQLDATLESLNGREDRVNYEERAKLQLDTDASMRLGRLRFTPKAQAPRVPSPTVERSIESDADQHKGSQKDTVGGRIAIR